MMKLVLLVLAAVAVCQVMAAPKPLLPGTPWLIFAQGRAQARANALQSWINAVKPTTTTTAAPTTTKPPGGGAAGGGAAGGGAAGGGAAGGGAAGGGAAGGGAAGGGAGGTN